MKLLAHKSRGFTLIEVIVVVGIMAFLSTGGFLMYRDYIRRQTLVQAGEDLRSNLVKARQRALSGEKPASCTGTLQHYQFDCGVGNMSYSVEAICSGGTAVVSSSTLPSGVSFQICPTFNFNILAQGTDLVSETSLILTDVLGRTVGVIVKPTGVIQFVN